MGLPAEWDVRITVSLRLSCWIIRPGRRIEFGAPRVQRLGCPPLSREQRPQWLLCFCEPVANHLPLGSLRVAGDRLSPLRDDVSVLVGSVVEPAEGLEASREFDAEVLAVMPFAERRLELGGGLFVRAGGDQRPG